MSDPSGQFVTTQWSLVLAAGQPGAQEASRALAALCQSYWHPLYVYARRRGKSAEDAADLTQSFFAVVIEKSFLDSADPDRGRFRTFLLTLFQRFLAQEYRKENTQKQGGHLQKLSFDFEAAEQLCSTRSESTPAEAAFEKEWALTLLGHVMDRLAADYQQRGKADLFERCRTWLNGTVDGASEAMTARELGMTEGALRVAIHRLRERFRELLRSEIAETIGPDTTVEQELAHLRQSLLA